jgi:hypothetical protein
MGGPGGSKPPGGGVTGVEPPLRGAPEARRAVGRGETSPLPLCLLVVQFLSRGARYDI